MALLLFFCAHLLLPVDGAGEAHSVLVGTEPICPNPPPDPVWPLPDRSQCKFHEAECANPRQRPLLQFGMCGGQDKKIGGTTNQWYSLMAGLALGYALQADVILPTLQHRDSFGSNTTNVQWEPLDLETLYDVAYLKQYWRDRGMQVYTQEDAKAMDRPIQRILAPKYTMDRDLLYWRSAFIFDIDPCGTTLLEFDCILFTLKTTEHLDLVEEVLPSLKFKNDKVETATNKILSMLANAPSTSSPLSSAARKEYTGHSGFDAIHLRIEADFSVWQTSPAEQMEMALSAWETAELGAGGRPVYVATAVFGYASKLRRFVTDRIQDQFHRPFVHKRMLLNDEEFYGMNLEEHAVVDLLVCIHSRRFVGYGESSFSFFVGEQRAIRRAGSLEASAPISSASFGTAETERNAHKAANVPRDFTTHYYGYIGRVFLTTAVLSPQGQHKKFMTYQFT